MKTLLIGIAILSATQAHAWNKVLTCDSGDLVVDQELDSSMNRPIYQLVLRGRPLSHFLQAKAIDPRHVNSNGEFVTPLNTHDNSWLGFRPHGTRNGMQTYLNYRLSHHDGEASLRAKVGNRYLGESELANWQFHGCR